MAAQRYKVLSAEVASDESQSYSHAQHSAVVVTSTGTPQDFLVAKARSYLRTVIILSGIGLGLSVLMMVLTGVAFSISISYTRLNGGFATTAGFWMTIPQIVFFGLSLALAIRARQQVLHFADVQQHNCCSQPGMICIVIFNSIILLLAMMGAIALIIGTTFLTTAWSGMYAAISVCAVGVFGLDITMLVLHCVLLCRQRWTVGPRGGIQGGAMTTTTTVQTVADPATTMPQHVVASPATAPEWTAQ